MLIDMTYLGYGVGLVMVGWFLGMCIRVVFTVIGRVGVL